MFSFVLSNLGFSYLLYEDFVILYCIEIVKIFFREDDSNVVVVLDGMYIYIYRKVVIISFKDVFIVFIKIDFF